MKKQLSRSCTIGAFAIATLVGVAYTNHARAVDCKTGCEVFNHAVISSSAYYWFWGGNISYTTFHDPYPGLNSYAEGNQAVWRTKYSSCDQTACSWVNCTPVCLGGGIGCDEEDPFERFDPTSCHQNPSG